MKDALYLLGVVALGLAACAYGSLGVDESALVEGDAADGGLREAGGSGSRAESGASPPPGASGPDATVSRPPPDAGGPDAESLADASDSGSAHDAALRATK